MCEYVIKTLVSLNKAHSIEGSRSPTGLANQWHSCSTTLHPTCDILICFANDARNICLPEILLLTLSASVSTSY